MYATFGSNKPLVLAILLVPAALLGWLTLTHVPLPANPLAGDLFLFIYGLVGSSPMVHLVIGILLELVLAGLLAHLCTVHHIHRRENYFTALVCFLFLATQLNFNYFNPIVLAMILVLFAMSRMLALFRAEAITEKLFVGGFFMGLAVLVYPPFLLICPILWIALSMLRPFQLREFIIPSLGLITPLVYLAFYHFWTLAPFNGSAYLVFPSDATIHVFGQLGTFDYVHAIAVSLILLLGLASYFSAMNASTVQKKNTKGILIILSILFLAVWFYLGFQLGSSATISAVLAIPVSIFAAYTFSNSDQPIMAVLSYYLWLVLTLILPLQVLFD